MGGPKPHLSADQLAELAQIVETGPEPRIEGVVRWRRVDLKRVISERFGVAFHERYVGKLLKKLGFSHMSARPRHPAQNERVVETFKKRMARPVCKGFFESADDQSAATYPASEDSSQPRWRYAHSGPHKLPGVERRFLNQAFGAPFDCQAISISPLANLIDRSANASALPRPTTTPPRAVPRPRTFRRAVAPPRRSWLACWRRPQWRHWDGRAQVALWPIGQRGVALGDMGQRRSRAVDQQLAKISVASLADAKNVWPAPSARDFSRAPMISLLQRIRLRRTPPSQDGDTRTPVLINFPASSAVF